MPAPQRRLWHDDRHRQLLEVAEALLSKRGWDGLRIPDLAEAAGVTRPIVYKHFRSRKELVIELVRAYAGRLQTMLLDAANTYPREPERALKLSLDVLCDALEERGPGAWYLLTSGGPDPEINRAIEALRDGLMRPWIPRVRKVTGLSARHALLLCHLTFASVRTVLDLWAAKKLSRSEVERVLSRSISAQLREFASDGGGDF